MAEKQLGTEHLDLKQVYHSFYGKNLDGAFQNERVLTVTASAMGRLRKELIETIGVDRTKGFLLRYGWNCGLSDALNIVETYGVKEESLSVGPLIHTMHGYQDGNKIDQLEVDFAKKSLYLEGRWWNSYEAQEYIKLFGNSDQPVCHTLTGLASGYLSTIMGEKVIVKEVECQAMGHGQCRVICRTVKEWGTEIDSELQFYEMDNLIHELDQTYEQLKKERDNLNRTFDVHEKMMQEILRDKSLASQVELLYKITKYPAVIEDSNHQILAVAGMAEGKEYVKELVQTKNTDQTQYFQIHENLGILKSPIYLHQKVVAYYSFFYERKTPQDIDKIIIERAALACSFSLLKEQIRFQSEQRVRGRFLEDILSGSIDSDEMIKRAYYLGVKLHPPYLMITFQAASQSSFLEKLEFNNDVLNSLDRYFKDHHWNALMGQKSENMIILLSGNSLLKNQRTLQGLSKELSQYLETKYPENQFTFGISSISTELSEMEQLYDESQVALKVANPVRNIVSYEALGIEGIFFQENNLGIVQKLIRKRMGKLIEEDKLKNGELLKTLYYYLNTGCNVLKTARNMNFSVSGLRYRLDRISDILETDIKRPSNTYQIFMALQFLILSGEVDIELQPESDDERDSDEW